MSTTTRMSIFLPSMLALLVIFVPALFLLVFLPLALLSLVFLPWCYLFWSFCSLCHLPDLFATGATFCNDSSSFYYSFPPFCSSPLFCSSSFSFFRCTGSSGISYQNLIVHFCYTTPISLSLIQVFRASLLLFKEDYVVQRSISSLKISRKRLQFDIDKTNKNKLQYQPVVASREEKTKILMFSCSGCISELKLNIE